MRKVVAILLAFVVVFLVLRSPLFKPALTTPPTTPTPAQDNTSGNVPAPTTGSNPTSKGEVSRPSDATVAAAFDEIQAAWDKVEQFTAKVEMTIPNAAGNPGKTIGKGEYKLMKKNGNMLIYFTLTNELRIRKDDGNMLVTVEILETWVDGAHRYSLISQPGFREATKNSLNYDDVLQIGGPYLMRELVNNYTLSVMPEEMKDNRATRVIKAKPKDGEWESLHYFDKASGLRVEMIEMGADGKPSLTIKLPQIDTTTPIDEEKFKAVIPPEVPLQDKTGAP